MKGQILKLDITIKCGKYKKETHNDLTIKEALLIINEFFKNELEIEQKISYNTIQNLIMEKRPKNKLLLNFLDITKR
jgi:hypothetical protein